MRCMVAMRSGVRYLISTTPWGSSTPPCTGRPGRGGRVALRRQRPILKRACTCGACAAKASKARASARTKPPSNVKASSAGPGPAAQHLAQHAQHHARHAQHPIRPAQRAQHAQRAHLRRVVSVHLHHVGIDLGVNHYPAAANNKAQTASKEAVGHHVGWGACAQRSGGAGTGTCSACHAAPAGGAANEHPKATPGPIVGATVWSSRRPLQSRGSGCHGSRARSGGASSSMAALGRAPGAAAELAAGWEVYHHRLAVRPQTLHDQRAGLRAPRNTDRQQGGSEHVPMAATAGPTVGRH